MERVINVAGTHFRTILAQQLMLIFHALNYQFKFIKRHLFHYHYHRYRSFPLHHHHLSHSLCFWSVSLSPEINMITKIAFISSAW